MRKSVLLAAFVLSALTPALAHAQDVVIEPGVDAWVVEQQVEPGLTIDGEISVGSPLPDTVTVIEVPDNDRYGYVVVNKRRVLVERDTRKVVKVYE